MNYGPYHKPGQDPNRPDDPPITDAQFREDLGKIVQKFGYIRTYGTEKRVLGLGPFVAQDYPHLNVYLGIYKSSKYRSATEEQIAKAIELANKYPNIVEYVIVGNECLDQDFADGAVSVEQLIADINKVKQSVPANVKVTTCLGFHSAVNPQKMEDGSPNPYSGRARIMESGSRGSQKPIA